MSRMGKRQRERIRRHREGASPIRAHPEFLRLEREAAALPADGPIAALVAELDGELSRLVLIESASHEAVPFLKGFGRRAFDTTGSVDGMRAIAFKAASMDPRSAEMRRDMLDKGWDGIGDERGCWCA